MYFDISINLGDIGLSNQSPSKSLINIHRITYIMSFTDYLFIKPKFHYTKSLTNNVIV